MGKDILALCSLVKVLIVCSVLCEQVIKLVNEAADRRNKLDKSLWDKYYTEVVTACGTVSHSRGYLLNNLVEGHILLLYLLRNNTDVWLALQSALKCDV